MTNGYMRQAAAMYQQTRVHGSVEGADPHQLTGMLLEGAIERINQAKGHISRGDVAAKGASISKSLAIVGELRGSLDHKVDASLCQRLDSLYEYVSRRLLFAQLNNDLSALDESARLLIPVRDAWHAIRGEQPARAAIAGAA